MRTYGYDYAFAIATSEVNKILTSNLQNTDLELKYSGTDSASGSTISLDGVMSPWQIIKGGQNSLLRFSIPFSDGYMSIEGPISKSYDLTGVTILIEVSLGWLGTGTEQKSSGSGDVTKLIFSPTQTTDPNNPGYVAVVNILDPDKRLDTVGLGLLRNYTSNILFENKDKINFIFADVFPKPAKVGSWLVPKKWVYFYSTGASYDALCFLCMLDDDSIPSSPAFDSGALTSSGNATILISQASFFKNVVLPSIESTFTDGKFVVNVSSDETCSITNKGNFTVKTKKGNITAKSFKLTASDSGNGLKTKTSGGGPLKFFFGLGKLPNASYSWSCQNTNPLQYKSGNISFLADNKPVTHHDQTIHWYDWVLLAVVGITSLPGLVSFIVDTIEDFSDQINSVGISNVNGNLQSASAGSLVNLSNLIDWSTKGGQKFTSQNSGLSGALYVYGSLS